MFRLLHLLNLFLLAASAPLAAIPGSYTLASIQDLELNCSEPEYLVNSFKWQFSVITILDFVLAVLFTAHLVLRFCYAIYLREGYPLGVSVSRPNSERHFVYLLFLLLSFLQLSWRAYTAILTGFASPA